MPCNCCRNKKNAVTADTQIITDPSTGVTYSTAPQGVCRTNPCSTRNNITAIQADQSPAQGTDCSPFYPEPTAQDLLAERRPCTDQNGCTAFYRPECRDGFWPDFSHPRWLCCKDLYNAG